MKIFYILFELLIKDVDLIKSGLYLLKHIIYIECWDRFLKTDNILVTINTLEGIPLLHVAIFIFLFFFYSSCSQY